MGRERKRLIQLKPSKNQRSKGRTPSCIQICTPSTLRFRRDSSCSLTGQLVIGIGLNYNLYNLPDQLATDISLLRKLRK